MKATSKSKTFSKGTDFQEVADFITDQIETTDFDLYNLEGDDCQLTSKYLITVVKYTPDKEEEK